MHEFDQILPTCCGLREGWIGCENFDREVDFVDNALAGTMVRIEQFEIFKSVVPAISVNVVNGFLREQVSTQTFRHDMPMFHDVLAAGPSESRDGDPHVAVAFHVPAVVSTFEFFKRLGRLGHHLAVVVAIFLLFVEATARLATFGVFFAARLANESIARFTGFATAHARALARAVQRVSSIFLVVCSDEVFHHEKTFAAFLAGEVKGSSAFGRDSFRKAVRTPARETAVLSVFTRVTGKRLLAVFTDFLNRHSTILSFGDESSVAMSVENVK